jgi:hypothetical protein
VKQGDQVRVYPHGQPEQAARGTVVLISMNQRSIAVGFSDKQPFAHFDDPLPVHPEHGIVLMAVRYDAGPWTEVFGHGPL